jgi:(p)ppGpp synthase/HD superfamily hydrolase
MITLEKAIQLAAAAHEGQTDKGGARYILHPLRVMLAQSSDAARIVAVFHDVCEDAKGWTFDRLPVEGFTPELIAALDGVTKRDGEDYPAFIARAAANPISRAVKMADLHDNLDIRRIPLLREEDLARINKYKAALRQLEA